MRRLIALPIVLALFVAPLQTASDTAYACSCVSQTLPERVETSDLVFVGTLVRFEGESPVFAVERYYKGSGFAEMPVRDPIGGGAGCSYFGDGGLVHDERAYLVFASAAEAGYSTSLCSGNVSAADSDYEPSVAAVTLITGPGQPPDVSPPQEDEDEHTEDTPWAVILPIAFAIPLAVLVIPALLRRRGGGS